MRHPAHPDKAPVSNQREAEQVAIYENNYLITTRRKCRMTCTHDPSESHAARHPISEHNDASPLKIGQEKRKSEYP
jgi:hypothetical protein